MIDLLRDRRSIRRYLDRQIEAEKIELLREAALRAPSSRKIDPCEFIFVDDRATLEKLAACKPHGAAFLNGAALGIVICGDDTRSDVCVEDCSIASILIQMAAQSVGLGSCWIQVRKRMHDDHLSAEQYMQTLLGIPDHVRVESIVAVGYPAEHRTPLPAEELKTSKVHLNRF
ncbi:nitroreductase family protein [Anaerobaca lacustris]|uniref:Nitroreductase family protein n=1 Tax=Anaerobaca lacustris TaxID=3044600 RepID=A0AAW6TVJ6_9BACT|nr:nitroreductase family protein [Sedimentisphaerales bacterium M17dextr]